MTSLYVSPPGGFNPPACGLILPSFLLAVFLKVRGSLVVASSPSCMPHGMSCVRLRLLLSPSRVDHRRLTLLTF